MRIDSLRYLAYGTEALVASAATDEEDIRLDIADGRIPFDDVRQACRAHPR